MRISYLVCLAALLTASACNPYKCVYKTRFVSTQPESGATAAGSFTGTVNLRDYSDGEPVPVTIGWNLQVTGAPAGLTNMTLRDKRDMSKVLATIGFSQSGVAASAGAPLQTRAERDATFGTLVSGNAVLVADLGGSAPILVNLIV